MKKFFANLIADERGASAAEYGLILAIVGVAIGGAALGLANTVQDSIEAAADDVYDCNGGSDGETFGDCTAYDPGASGS